MSADVRESTILSWDTGLTKQSFVRHAATGSGTLCGIALGGSIPDPPGYEPTQARPCHHRVCRNALAALNGAAA